MSSAFSSAVATPRPMPPDTTKHVNYTLGMLLGVDDFNQEFAYLSGRDRWLARDLLGYGTTNGLRVSTDKDLKGPRVVVAAGSAVSPSGCMICVDPAQCAYINDWLVANQANVSLQLLSPPGALNLYLVLCYRSCPVDRVPIPGEPCRSESDLMAPSRLQDSFTLDMQLEAPKQPEEDGIREFAAWLDQVEVTDAAGVFTTPDAFAAALHASVPAADFVKNHGLILPLGSPLFGMRVHTADAGACLRSAMRIWITEIRPLVHTNCSSTGCCCGGQSTATPPATDDCVLLAHLHVPIVIPSPAGPWLVDDTKPVAIDESHRPIVVHLRMLQELWAASAKWWR
jgi:hypothetical protein